MKRILLLKPYKQWETVGSHGKLARHNLIVTNFNSGGRIISAKKAMMTYGRISEVGYHQLQARIDKLTAHMAKHYFN